MRIVLIAIGILLATTTLSAHPDTHIRPKARKVVVVKTMSPAKKKIWIAGHWVKVPHGKVWIAGHWKSM